MTRREAALGLSASLAAHVALTAAVVLAVPRGPGAPRDTRPEAITRLRLVRGGEPGHGAAAVEISRPARRAERRPRAAPVARAESSAPPASPAVGSVAATAASSGESLAPEVVAPGVPGAEGAEGASGGDAPGGIQPAAGAEAGGSMALAALARRLEEVARGCYPQAARKLRLRGEVGLVFCVGEGGLASSVRVERSSGSPLLDGAAADCVVPRALPSPGASGCFSLPVRFGAGEGG